MRVPTTLKQYDGDWEPCEVPTNVFVDETAYIFAAECFGMVRSEREIGVQIGKASQVNDGSCFDVEHLLGRPVAGRKLHCGSAPEVGVGACDEVVVRRSLGGGVSDSAHGVAALVVGRVFGDDVGDYVVVDADAWLAEDVVEVADAEPDDLRLQLPSSAELLLGDSGRFRSSRD